MPATMTHAYFAMDVFDKLDDNFEWKKLIKNNLLQYKMFAQSMDSLMFYNIESLGRGSDIRKLQYIFHTEKTQEFFCSLVLKIKEKNLIKNQMAISFLMGLICHYVLDSNVHPFVFYKTGNFDKKDKSTYKYNNLHSFMETFIDLEMMKKNGISNPYGFRIDKFTFDLTKFDEKVSSIIDDVFLEVYGVKEMSRIYYKSLVQMRRFIRRYRMDKYGIKRIGYKCIDKITPTSMFRFEALSYHYKTEYGDYFLNTNNDIWYNPVSFNISSCDSFFELYDKSVSEALSMIHDVYKYLFFGVGDLMRIFKNTSYVSGMSCDVKLKFKKFAF